jgi:transposase
MEVVHARCCGIDAHQASLAVCVTIKEGGKSDKHKLRCGTTTAELLRLADWLHGYQVTDVAMEATGVYWKPVWHILEGHFELLLANPTQVRALRGRKSDLKDGERIADFLQHGLLQGSFVPPQPIQQLRDLTRSRTTLKQEQVRIGNPEGIRGRQPETQQRDVGRDGGFWPGDAAGHCGGNWTRRPWNSWPANACAERSRSCSRPLPER